MKKFLPLLLAALLAAAWIAPLPELMPLARPAAMFAPTLYACDLLEPNESITERASCLAALDTVDCPCLMPFARPSSTYMPRWVICLDGELISSGPSMESMTPLATVLPASVTVEMLSAMPCAIPWLT